MSIIYQVLKDLERRRGDTRDDDKNILSGIQVPEFSASRDFSFYFRYVAVGASLALGVLLLLFCFFYAKAKWFSGAIPVPHFSVATSTKKPDTAHSSMTGFSKEITDKNLVPGSMKKTAVPLTAKQRAEHAYHQGMMAFNTGDGETAEAILKDLVQHQPNYLPARQALALIWLRRGNAQAVNHLLREGLRLVPSYVPFSFLRAQALVMLGEQRQALRQLTALTPSLPDHLDYYAMLAVLYQELGHPKAAASLYEQLVVLTPREGRWWLGLGIAEEALKNRSEAVHAYHEALKSPNLALRLQNYSSRRLALLED